MTSDDSVHTIAHLKAAQEKAHKLTSDAMRSALQLWRSGRKGAIQTSRDEESDHKRNYRPTASFHVICAYAETGVWLPTTRFVAGELKTPYVTVRSLAAPPPEPEEALQGILEGGGVRSSVRLGWRTNWVRGVISRSSHAMNGANAPRILITFERLVGAVNGLMATPSRDLLATYERHLRGGLLDAERILRSIVMNPKSRRFADPSWLGDTGRFSTMILHHMLLSLVHLDQWAAHLEVQDRERHLTRQERAGLQEQLRDILARQLDRYLARQSVQRDPAYDPVSLAFAVRGLQMAEPDFADQSIFDAAIAAVVAGQLKDGCWPDGASFTTSSTADVVQQPSVEVALLLAECVITGRKSLVDVTQRSTTLLATTREALKRMAEYLQATFTATVTGGDSLSGWSSDRVRRPQFIETWITALAARFLWNYWLVETSLLRAYALGRFGVLSHTGDESKVGFSQEDWFRGVVEPDQVIRPCHVIWTEFVAPIIEQRKIGRVIQRPTKSAVSMIIFGPPGSGKTFFVSRIAEFLGWPLVTITPGHFIKHGLEAIEAVATEIFDHLHALEHAVVLFDECDELFRQREPDPRVRGILSFATASMLPKLQNLHDAARIVFILGTNYVRNIDTAIRRPGRFDRILLFDRPDQVARREWIRRTSRTKQDTVSVDRLVASTAGFMVKQVQEAAVDHESTKTVSIDDYLEWCDEEGALELEAAGIPEPGRREIVSRWRRVALAAETSRS